MSAALTVATDKEGRDHCVVVVKGTFVTDPSGTLRLADRQRLPVEADEHHGDPGSTSLRYECDFALTKQYTDVLVVGHAVVPGGRRATELPVRLEVAGRVKDALVVGDRRWVRAAGGLVPSHPPVAFQQLPLTYERAAGGPHESRNLVGAGAAVEGAPLPNLERPGLRTGSPGERLEPVGFGSVSRNWSPRMRLAGTYDRRWFEQVRPFLPHDFDSRYFQSAPEDQQFPHFVGGEQITCVHMAAEPVVRYVIPRVDVPVRFTFRDREEVRPSVLDTVVLEPHLSLACLVWRSTIPLPKQLVALRSVTVGVEPPASPMRRRGPTGYRGLKPRFDGLAEAVRFLHGRRGSRA
jgi:hypothetical protein